MLNIRYTVILGEIDLVQLFKKYIYVVLKRWKFTRFLFFFFFLEENDNAINIEVDIVLSDNAVTDDKAVFSFSFGASNKNAL
jgi:hypothetical protein